MDDPVLELMRSMGLPDPGTPEADDWVRDNIEIPAWLAALDDDEEVEEEETI